MELSFKKKNRTLMIRIYGEIDHHTSADLRRQVESAFMEMGGRNIIFDFKNVIFMDSSGIGMIIGRYKQIRNLGGRICITNANEKIIEIIELSGLKTLVPIYRNIDEAITYTEGRDLHAL